MLCLKQQELHLRVKSSLLKYDRTRDLRATTASLLVCRPDEPKEPLLPLVHLRTRMRCSSYIPKNIHIQHISLAELHKLGNQVSLGVSHCSAKLKKRQPQFSQNNGSSSGQQKKCKATGIIYMMTCHQTLYYLNYSSLSEPSQLCATCCHPWDMLPNVVLC